MLKQSAGADQLQGQRRNAGYAVKEQTMRVVALIAILLGMSWGTAWAIDPPCDKYPPAKQIKCAAVWKELNQEDGPSISQFGLAQLKRREEGKINAEQHLSENMTFIKQSTQKRLERLRARMEKE